MKIILSVTIASLLLVGCASNSSPEPTTSAAQKSAKQKPVFVNTAKAGSKFAKLNTSMGMAQVYAITGQATDIETRTTGKAWIPFYYGSDRYRFITYHKGEGKLEFNARKRLVAIQPDPTEDGYR